MIKDEQNKLKRVRTMPLVSQESVHAKPQQLPPNLAESANIGDKLPAANIPNLLPNQLLIFVSAKEPALSEVERAVSSLVSSHLLVDVF